MILPFILGFHGLLLLSGNGGLADITRFIIATTAMILAGDQAS
jgi:hypothetical protein